MEFDERSRVLSLHQPWASLLVNGIKRIENRNWSTDFRGQLWIHAASRRPPQQEVQELEELYKFIYQMEGYEELLLPESYPTSVLLGCVHVVDCLTAGDVEHWQQLPESIKLEVAGKFCFLCEDPQILVTPEPMRGYPRLWKLPLDLTTRMERILRTPSLIDISIRWSQFL